MREFQVVLAPPKRLKKNLLSFLMTKHLPTCWLRKASNPKHACEFENRCTCPFEISSHYLVHPRIRGMSGAKKWSLQNLTLHLCIDAFCICELWLQSLPSQPQRDTKSHLLIPLWLHRGRGGVPNSISSVRYRVYRHKGCYMTPFLSSVLQEALYCVEGGFDMSTLLLRDVFIDKDVEEESNNTLLMIWPCTSKLEKPPQDFGNKGTFKKRRFLLTSRSQWLNLYSIDIQICAIGKTKFVELLT